MIKIKNLTVRNFMSVGNQTQAIDFDKGQLTLVLGENLDLGGDDSGARNGTGKTTIINGLSYAIYGQALTNIKRDNLINKINSCATTCPRRDRKDRQSCGRRNKLTRQECESNKGSSQTDPLQTGQSLSKHNYTNEKRPHDAYDFPDRAHPRELVAV